MNRTLTLNPQMAPKPYKVTPDDLPHAIQWLGNKLGDHNNNRLRNRLQSLKKADCLAALNKLFSDIRFNFEEKGRCELIQAFITEHLMDEERKTFRTAVRSARNKQKSNEHNEHKKVDLTLKAWQVITGLKISDKDANPEKKITLSDTILTHLDSTNYINPQAREALQKAAERQNISISDLIIKTFK